MSLEQTQKSDKFVKRSMILLIFNCFSVCGGGAGVGGGRIKT